ncbi:MULTISPECIES: LacI family DNA-binding transcriptional regulator [unclassified Flavobacterium]|jgi:LacI family transcriptional regulator|uniref:LacI family DNA-binding transcriptional regulator n=1 Tax=unclassified Flavobacterium TaxID=196869 RepID=UPI0025C584EE|nr:MULTISPECIES: LacI family DNA-binding transcriptional regulator [unclassified Flavobacterium]
MKKIVTINDIAKIANVSRGTVDRVVNNRGYVAEDKLKLIQKIIEELNFVPNTHGRNLALNKSLTIAMVFQEHSEGDYWEPLINAGKDFNKNYLHLGLKINFYFFDLKNLAAFNEIEKEIFSGNNDAVITTKPQNPTLKAFLKKCLRNKLPFVLVGSSDTKYGALSNVGQDSLQSGRLAGKLINYRQDHNAIYVIFNLFSENNINDNVMNRIKGFKTYFAENNKPKIKVEVMDISIDDPSLIDKIKERINTLDENDGIFIPNSKGHFISQFVDKEKIKRVVGFDLIRDNINSLKIGKIDFLINQKPYDQAYQGLEILYRYLGTNQKPLDVVLINEEVITSESSF